MTPKRPLINQLKNLDRLYRNAVLGADPNLPKYYSRLAVLELGSWIEECMKEIVFSYPKRKRIKERSNLDYVASILHCNYGFDYKKNFRKMIKSVSGIVVLEKTEQMMDQTLKQGLKSALTLLYPERNNHAHKPIRLTPGFTAPSVCLAQFEVIYKGLLEYEKFFKKV